MAKKSKHQFRIRHGQPEYSPAVGMIPPGPVQVFVAQQQDAPAFRSKSAHRSRAGVKYASVSSQWQNAPLVHGLPKSSGYDFALAYPDKSRYLKKHGTMYRAGVAA